MVDALGRFVDIGLRPSWWSALGPEGVAAGLLEALASARMKAALVPMILRRSGYAPLPVREPAHARPEGESDLRAQIADADRLIDDGGKGERETTRIIDGPRGLFRLHVRGGRVERAELLARPVPGDTDRLLADAREALAKVGRQ
ncbi:hypothetical protein ACQPZX_45290 [Actinoplanes sp. CA-142083]|uniref:hypothetical protein n=1 Tax=Actinoplanes sp. CA-142083 TaxID=3239903 RepID=UPI003D945CC3